MRRGLIWGGFGALLLVGVLSGYVPDLMLASALSGARAEGLLTSAPTVDPKADARRGYEAAARKYADGWNLLGNDFARQIKAPAPHVVKYLDAMAEASRLPACSPLSLEWSSTYYGRPEADVVARAAQALTARADDEASLLAAARVAHHLGVQGGPVPVGHWAILVPKILDRAKALGVAPGPVAAALGPPVTPRAALRRHVAEVVTNYERTRKTVGGVGQVRREAAYLRFWRGFLAKHPEAGFTEALRREDQAVEDVENGGAGYADLSSVTGATPTLWAAWAAKVETADARLRAGR